MASGVRVGSEIEVAFSRHSGICRSDEFITVCKPGPAYRFPAGSGPGHQAHRKETRLLIVATSSGRLFLDRDARQHCPSPLHRHPQFNMHFPQAPATGDISTLPGWGHFYFALTLRISGLRITLPTDIVLGQFRLAWCEESLKCLACASPFSSSRQSAASGPPHLRACPLFIARTTRSRILAVI